MRARRVQQAIGVGALGLIAAVVVPLSSPLRVAWHCYALHAGAERERAEVIRKLGDATLALQGVDGSHAGRACTADTSRALFATVEPGDVLEVVFVPDRPGECELGATIEASGQLLWTFVGLLAAVVLAVAALAALLARSFRRPAPPARPMQVRAPLRCPTCGETMEEGAVVLLGGVHWRGPEEATGLPHALSGLPGTVGWRGRPRLHAFRCPGCELATFQYGAAASHAKRRAG